MLRGKGLIVTGAVTLVAGLIVTFPARVAYQWFAPPDLALSGISGTVWSGAAAEGSIAAIYFRDLSWRFRPLSLLTLKAAYQVAARPVAGNLESRVAIASGRVIFERLSASMPLAAIEPLLPQGIEGDARLQFDRLVLIDGIPTEADGVVTVNGLVIRALSPSAIGDYRALLVSSDGGLRGQVEDLSGVLEISASLALERGAYSLAGDVAARPDAPRSIVDQLQFLGSPDAQGRREFRFEGEL